MSFLNSYPTETKLTTIEQTCVFMLMALDGISFADIYNYYTAKKFLVI